MVAFLAPCNDPALLGNYKSILRASFEHVYSQVSRHLKIQRTALQFLLNRTNIGNQLYFNKKCFLEKKKKTDKNYRIQNYHKKKKRNRSAPEKLTVTVSYIEFILPFDTHDALLW